MAHAFSQPSLGQFLDQRFRGEWKYLRKSLHERADVRADRALLEMATQLRILDDLEGLSKGIEKDQCFGVFSRGDGSVDKLNLRTMTNKIIHASRFEWDFSDQNDPKVICHPTEADRWQRAEISLFAVAGLIGSLTF
jgi:hypothetical protein